jgi:hypothetical protein
VANEVTRSRGMRTVETEIELIRGIKSPVWDKHEFRLYVCVSRGGGRELQNEKPSVEYSHKSLCNVDLQEQC